MSKQRVTLKEIANQLGVTVTTVSKALKDYPDIGKETKRKVRELAERLNYTPDSQALALRNQKTSTIGLILPEIVHFFFSNVIKGIMDYCEERGYRLLITLSDNQKELEAKQVKLLFNTKVDGVLVSLANETVKAEHFKLLQEYGVPVVMFDKVDESFNCHQVVIDDVAAAYTATKHLVNKGCKRIALLAGPTSASNSIKREEGYRKALAEAGMPIQEDYIKHCELVVYEEGYAFTKELLGMETPPDGIFAVTDQLGAAANYAAQEMKLSVPKQLKIVGFSDSQIGRISRPQLTTIHQPGYKIGEAAVKLLIQEIERNSDSNETRTYETVIVDTHLIERGTT